MTYGSETRPLLADVSVSMVLCGRDERKFQRKLDLHTTNHGASSKASPFHALIELRKNDCPY